MSSSYIISGCRTPIGRLLGALSPLSATELGAVAVREAIRRSSLDPAAVDEVILGNVLSAGLGQAPARQVALSAGVPSGVAALTVNKVCGSGLKAVMLADDAIRLGRARVVVAGGMESMTRAPHLLTGAREGWKFGGREVLDSMQHDGLWCAVEEVGMGVQADYIAQSHSVSRADQDAFAAESHRRAISATASGKFGSEIVPITISHRKGDTIISKDEGPREGTTAAGLAKLQPAFGEEGGEEGTVTAGNASQISDGAAAVVVVSEEVATGIETPIKARIVASATSGVDPKEIFIAPVDAIEKVLAQAKMTVAEIELFELNEAFAAQSLACMRPLGLDPEKTNVHGGAIALGHPIGASGARVLVTLLHALAERDQRFGLAALCLGGGEAVTMIIEQV